MPGFDDNPYLIISPTPRSLPKTANPYDDLIERHASEQGVDPNLIRAVMRTESSNNPNAVSRKNATGLMQLMPGTARRFGVRNIRDPNENIQGGAKYLRFLNDRFKGNLDLVLAGYNAGEGAVEKYGNKIPPYRETQQYVPAVKARYQKLTGGMNLAPQQPQEQNPYLITPQQPEKAANPYLVQETQPEIPRVPETPPDTRASWASRIYNAKPRQPKPSKWGTGTIGQGVTPTQVSMTPARPPIQKQGFAGNPLIPVDRNAPTGQSNDAALMEQATKNVAALTFSPTANVKSLYRMATQGKEAGFESDVQEEFQRLKAAQQRAGTPEMVEARKEFGAQPAAIRAMTQPGGRAGAGIVKTLAGISSLAGIAPNQVSDYLTKRANLLEESTQLPPLNSQGEEIVRGLPEKASQAVLDLGFSVAELIALKKATGLGLGPLMAIESSLKNTDKPVADRTGEAAEAYTMGKILDQHLSRPVSAAVFGAPTAVQSGLQVAQGNMSREDALLQTGIQAGAGFLLGGKGKANEPIPETRAEVPQTPEAIPEAQRPAEVGAITVGEPVRHPKPEIDGKPVLAKTADDRVVVENPENKAGVSIVKHRPELPALAELPETATPLAKEARERLVATPEISRPAAEEVIRPSQPATEVPSISPAEKPPVKAAQPAPIAETTALPPELPSAKLFRTPTRPENKGVYKGQRFWIGTVNKLDGQIENVYTREQAEAAGNHHPNYMTPADVEGIESGERAIFWIGKNGNIQSEWRSGQIPEQLRQTIENQISISGVERGVPEVAAETKAQPPPTEIPKGEQSAQVAPPTPEYEQFRPIDAEMNDTGRAQIETARQKLRVGRGDAVVDRGTPRLDESAKLFATKGAKVLPMEHPSDWTTGLGGQRVTDELLQAKRDAVLKTPNTPITPGSDSFNTFSDKQKVFWSEVQKNAKPNEKTIVPSHYNEIKWLEAGGLKGKVNGEEFLRKDGEPGDIYKLGRDGIPRKVAKDQGSGIYIVRHGTTDYNVGESKAEPTTTKAEAKTRPRRSAVPAEEEGRTLSQAVRAAGGIRYDRDAANRGELAQFTLREGGKGRLINNKGGRSLEDMAQDMAVEGYGWGDWAERQAGHRQGKEVFDIDFTRFTEALREDMDGKRKHYSTQFQPDAEAIPEYQQYLTDKQKEHDANETITLLENEGTGQIYDKIVEGKANESDLKGFRKAAGELGISPVHIEKVISSASTTGVPATPELREAPTVRSQVGRTAEQLGFVQEGLTQESARLPPKLPDQRARLIAEEQARQAARNPERTAARKTLADLKARGMTVDEYARQGSLIGETPSPEKLKLLRELEKGQAGAIDVDLLTLGVRPFAKEVAEKGRGAIEGAKQISDAIKSLVAPATRGPEARTTAAITRANASEMARAHDIAEKSLEGARDYFSKQKPESNYQFIDRMEKGQIQSDPKTQNFANTLRSMLDQRRDQIRALGTGKLENFIENYFPHIWKDPQKARDAFAQAFGRRSLEGSKAFLKQRKIPLTSEGLSYGLKPVSDNPIDLTILKLREMDKYLMAHKVMGEMKENGLLKFVKSTEKTPEGFKRIDDRVATVYGGPSSRPEGGQLIRGYYVAPEPAAKILNNYLSPGIESTALRVPFKAWRASANLLNQAQLGFSFFHGGFTTLDAMISRTALGLEDIFRHGKPLKGIGTIVSTPISPITNLAKGSRMLREWYQPGSQGAETAKMVDAMVQGGGRAKMDRIYINNASQRFMDTLKQGNLIGAALRLPGATIETAMKPVMQWLVPRQKAGIFAEMAKREIERLGPNASREQVRTAMAKAWDSVDNRMGQMVYDNIFWNKMTKDLAMASVRSVGWNLGTAREVAGGITDYLTLPKRALQKGRTDPLFTHKMAYATALPIVVGAMGAMTQYLLTGKRPEELKDYFFPQTGVMDENGNPERISFPSYMKDIFHLREEPGKVIASKAHPLISLVAETLGNKDYYGTKIRNEDDPLIQQLKDIALYGAKAVTPFSVRGYQKETERGGTLAKRMLPFVGITPAPSYINKSPAEKLLTQKIEARMPQGTRTKAEAERSQLRHQLQSEVRRGEDIRVVLREAIKQGTLKPTDARDIMQDARLLPQQLRFKQLGIDDALDVWDVMTPEEKERNRPFLIKKADLIGKLPIPQQKDTRVRFLTALRK